MALDGPGEHVPLGGREVSPPVEPSSLKKGGCASRPDVEVCPRLPLLRVKLPVSALGDARSPVLGPQPRMSEQMPQAAYTPDPLLPVDIPVQERVKAWVPGAPRL